MLQLIKDQFDLEFSSKYLDENKISDGSLLVANNEKSCDQSELQFELPGNPQPLDQLCNLSLIDDQLDTGYKPSVPSSNLFNFSSYKSIKASDVAQACSEYGSNTVLVVEEDVDNLILFGMVLDMKNQTSRVLRIRTDQYPDISATHEQIKTRNMPFSKDVKISNEAIYSFKFAEYQVKFDHCSPDLLSSPPMSANGCLKIKFLPYSTSGSLLPLLKVDIDRIKRLCNAYKNEEPWQSLGSVYGSENELKEAIMRILSKGEKSDDNFSPTSVETAYRTRNLDTTERVWEALKDVPDRKTARVGFLFTFGYLHTHKDLISLDRNLLTQFAQILNSSMHSGSIPEMEVLGLKMLIELGVNKATNDCLSIISSVSPSMATQFAEKNLNTTKRLETRLMHLHHMFKMACLACILMNTVIASECEKALGSLLFDTRSSAREWQSIFDAENLDLDFAFNHECNISASALSNSLVSVVPKLRIVSLSSCNPIKIEKRLVFEIVAGSGKNFVYHCHEMQVVDSVWLYED